MMMLVFYLRWPLGGIIVPVPVSKMMVHNNSASSSAATNTIIVFAAALEAR
jgi:hypothetical protein